MEKEKEIAEIRFAVIALLDVAINSESTLVDDSNILENHKNQLEKYIKPVKYSSVPIEQFVVPHSSSDTNSSTYEITQNFGGGRHTKRRKSKKARRTRRKF